MTTWTRTTTVGSMFNNGYGESRVMVQAIRNPAGAGQASATALVTGMTLRFN
ncbi:MAG: hypothetical protein WCE82_10560 [Halobacteriota archaeon]